MLFRSVIPIQVAPLRERNQDIHSLIQHFIKRYSAGRPKKMSEKTLELLASYAWPGNVRELKNWVERACILSKTDTIDAIDLEEHESTVVADVFNSEDKTLRAARAIFEKQFITKSLSENGGNISKTATTIGVERSHLHKKMKIYGIDTINSMGGNS